MASIYKPNGKRCYYTSFHVPDSSGYKKKLTRSTGETNRKKAQHAADSMEQTEVAIAGAGEEKGGKMSAIVAQVAEEARKGTLNATRARKAVAEILKVSTGEDMPEYTIGEWVAEWLIRKEGKSESTMRAYRTHTKHFLSWLGDRANNTLESLTVSDMRQLQQWLLDGAGRETKSNNTTAKQKMKTVSSIYLQAVKEGITNFNPAGALEPLPEADKLERKPFTLQEIEDLVDAAPSNEWKGLILMGAFTGLRLVDCVLLKWEDVDLKKKVIVTIPRKTKRKKTVVTIPIHTVLFGYLNKLPTPIDSGQRVFNELSKYTGAGRNGLSIQFTRIMEKANVSRGLSINTGSRTTYQRSFHSLRHTLTSLLADSNVSPEVRMQILGHKSEDVHAIYTHLDEATLKSAMNSIPVPKAK